MNGNCTSIAAQFTTLVQTELNTARALHGPVTGAHDGYAKILEELDEFWELVRSRDRSPEIRRAMLRELVQVAAMARRTAEDLGLLK